jgi:hypothetical protein
MKLFKKLESELSLWEKLVEKCYIPKMAFDYYVVIHIKIDGH